MGKKAKRDYIYGKANEEWYVYEDTAEEKAESAKNVERLKKKNKGRSKDASKKDEHELSEMAKRGGR